MNILNITSALHSKINATTDFQELLALSKALERLNIGSVTAVATYSDLFAYSPSNNGELFFVDDENRLYFMSLYGNSVVIFPIVQTSGVSTAYGWGSNANGKVGDNTIINRSSPVSVVGGFTDWVQVSVSSGVDSHSLGVRANGTIWAWGGNAVGQLGDNTITNRSSPVSVVGDFTDWISTSAGGNHSLALRANGTLWAWGNNANGQIGDNTPVFSKLSPVSVVGNFTDWIQASAGSLHSLGLRANGTLWAWGANKLTTISIDGRLGDNTTVDRSSPVSVVGGFSDWVQASAGGYHSLGVRANGTLWAWGAGGNGRLGQNAVTNRSSPISVIGGFTDWVQADAGSLHSLGVRANGSLWAWGNNGQGRLGDNTTANKSSPVSVVGGITDWVQASSGHDHSLGVRANGILRSWGNNSSFQLGQSRSSSETSPDSVNGNLTTWISASAGNSTSLGITVDKISAVR
jgi:alpha-tubulin suppressor-like RCC1 family protein